MAQAAQHTRGEPEQCAGGCETLSRFHDTELGPGNIPGLATSESALGRVPGRAIVQ